jgi:hypothetical protein
MSKEKPTHYIDITTDEALLRLQPHTIELLKETKIPKHAFVVFEIPKLKYDGGVSVLTSGIVVVNVEDQPGQIYTLDDLVNRNGKYCCHYNFPTHDHPDPLRAKKWLLYSDGGGSNPWDELTGYCSRQLGYAVEISTETRKYKEEIESLRAQLAKESKNEQVSRGRQTEASK